MISIIVPIYNAADYLEQCIRSLVQQTESDLQIILVDDGSTDRSRPILETFAKQDERIILLQQPHAVNRRRATAVYSMLRASISPL